ncbi:MAG TPA: VIT1/CCC1 transporter family protein [Candidatus Acidoferrales bacterium]|nr:VIT1/CCC1 transporter family protein [Candidatus Acidoferrales bacterium]
MVSHDTGASSPPENGRAEPVLILLPTGRDASVAVTYLHAAGLRTHVCHDMAEFCAALEGAAAGLLAEEALFAQALDPHDLGGSARVAAATSFALFALGASVPVAPFFVASGHAAVLCSLALSSLMLFGIGTAITVFTGRPVWLSGGRQLLLGLAAAAATFALGRAFGMALS